MNRAATRVALLQMTSGPDPKENLACLRRRLDRLRRMHPEVTAALTPENALVLGTSRDYRRVAETLGQGPCQQAVADLAREYGLWLFLGSFPVRCGDDCLGATTLVYDPDGQLAAHYQKLHLFDVDVPGDRGYRESDAFSPGDREVLVETPLGKVGLAICYDLRFPALFGRLRSLEAEVLTVPAAFTYTTGKAHWEVLLRARAIETQCFVLAPAQTGTHPDRRRTWGHSLAVDPWGKVLGQAGEAQEDLVVDLDRSELGELRARMPLEDHRRYQASLRPSRS